MAKEWKEDEGGDFDESQEDKRKDQNTQKPIGQEELLNEAKNFFQGNRKEVGQAAKRGEKIVHVNFEDLSEDSPLLAENIILKPEETVQLLELALEESGMISNARVRLINLAKTQEVKIRNIRAKHLGTMISVEGIVRQASEVRPRVVNAKFECPSCGSIISVLQLDNKFREPSRCSCGRRGGFKELSKDMVDAQGLKLEESPDSLSGGEQPKRMQIFLKEDLVEPKMEERTTPGSKVKVIGVLKEVPLLTSTGGIQTKFDLAVEANNIIPMEETFEDINISEEDERTIKELAANPKVMQKIVQSIAPSIWGHEEVKKALTLQMFGGVRKVMTDGTKKRGDVHILLVGDPGVAKSVMLKFIAGIAPKGRYVSGKSTSGAGLTATVVKDEFLRGWALEAGALVLSNKGLVAIDELEKMDENDRSTMHEAMEQQCMLPDFKLMLSNGRYVNIGEFVDNLMEKNKEIVIKGKDCEILNVKEVDLLSTDFRSHFNFPASKVSRHKAPEYFTKIELTNGREIIVTPEHPCWVVKDAKIETISAEQLKRGDFFPVPSRVNINSLEYKRENDLLCKIIGYHISDGSYELNRGKKTGIQFWNNDKNLIDDYFNTIKAYFKVNPTITTRKNQFAVRVISKEVKSKILGLDKNLMEKGDKKIIPYSLMSLPNENLKYLLRALFDGDGSVIFVKRNGARVSLVCENKELAEQVADLLLRFEIQSSIVYDKSSRVYRLGITGKYNLLNFMNSIEFLSVKKMSRLKQYCSKEISYKTIRDLIPNCTNKINQIFKELKINVKKELGHQIDLCVEKQRVFLQKLVTIAKSNLMNENLKYHHLYQDLEELDRLAFGYARWIKIKKVSKVKNKDITWVYDVTIPPYKHLFQMG